MDGLVNPTRCENCALLQNSSQLFSISTNQPFCITCTAMISDRETEALSAMELLFDSIIPFFVTQKTEHISDQRISRNLPFTNAELAESILGVIEEVELSLVEIHDDIVIMVADQNEEGITPEELDRKTREMEERLLEHVDDLIDKLMPLHHWALLLRGMKIQCEDAEWNQNNEYRNFIHSFEPVFVKLKKNISSNFAQGAKQYIKAFGRGVEGAWEARANARRYEIETLALPGLQAMVDLRSERAIDRERAEEKKKNRNKKKNQGRKKAKAKRKAETEDAEAEEAEAEEAEEAL